MTEELRIALIAVAAVLGALAVVLHVVCAFSRTRAASVLSYINILVHLLIFFALFSVGADLSVIALVLMASVCAYSLASYIAKRREDKR